METEFIHSKGFKRILIALVCIVLALIIFRAGMIVGFHQAGFSRGWGENYFNNFGDPHGFEPDDQGGPRPAILEAHGTLGVVIKIETNNIIVQGNDGAEKVVLIGPTTLIRQGNVSLPLSDVQLNEQVVIIGSPNASGQINAQFIRILGLSTTTSSTTSQL